jgi:pyruvate ferredoxin oxidoreductase delta subunit
MAQYKAPRLDRPWQEVTPGGVVTEHGNSVTYITGTWRTMRPVYDAAQCIQCLTCWIMCPDASVTLEEGKVVGFDYQHCKGCGICADVCPAKIKNPHAVTEQMGKVIQMVPETDYEQ